MISNVNDPCNGATDYVIPVLGEAYNVVKQVQSNLAAIQAASENIQAIIDATPAAQQVTLILSIIQALAAGVLYDNTAAGLDPVDGVLSGEFFATWESGRLRIYLNDAGVAVQKLELLTAVSALTPIYEDLSSIAAGKGAALVAAQDDGTGTLWTNVQGFINKMLTSGSTVVSVILAGVGAVSRTIQAKLEERVSAFDFMTPAQIASVKAGNLLVDVTTPLQNAINYCVANGVALHLPNGSYLVTQSLNLTFSLASNLGTDSNFYRGLTIHGKSRVHTKIVGKTSGFPVFDMTGARLCFFDNFQVRYDANDAFTPSCAFLLSRNLTNGGAGEHVFTNVGTYGYFSKAALANLSSEVNAFYNCIFINLHPDGHALYSSGNNALGITSNYVAGLNTLAYSGGNTRHVFVGCAFNHFGTSNSAGRAIYLQNGALSPSNDFLFSGCYSITEPTTKDSSIVIDGNCQDIVFDCHRDEAQTINSIVIKSGSTVSGLHIKAGQYAKGMYGQDNSVLQYSSIYPQRLAGTYDSGVGQFISIDLFGFQYSNMFSPGNNGVRLRDDLTGSQVQTSNLSTSNLFILGTGSKLNGFRYSVKRPDGSSWTHYLNGNITGQAGFTGMTTGFMYMPAGDGAPVGTPSEIYTGRVPFYYDRTNKMICVYDGGWKKSAALV